MMVVETHVCEATYIYMDNDLSVSSLTTRFANTIYKTRHFGLSANYKLLEPLHV